MKMDKAIKLINKALPEIEDARLRLALLRENFEYRRFFQEFKDADKKTDEWWPAWDFRKFGLDLWHFAPYPEREDILRAVDPFEENPLTIDDRYIPILLHDPAITLVDIGDTREGFLTRPIKVIPKGPWNRLYSVDLRKSRSQIEKEFKALLDLAFSEKADPDHNPSYDGWEIYNSRRRQESWKHLEVWKHRKRKHSFASIADQLHISVDAAKKSFARAYELTQHKRYDPELYRREVWIIKQKDLARTCNTCPDRDTCTELCLEMLSFVDQDQTAQSEKILNNPDYVDSLLFD